MHFRCQNGKTIIPPTNLVLAGRSLNTFLLYIDSVGTSQIDIHIQRPSMRPYKIGRLYESDSEDEY